MLISAREKMSHWRNSFNRNICFRTGFIAWYGHKKCFHFYAFLLSLFIIKNRHAYMHIRKCDSTPWDPICATIKNSFLSRYYYATRKLFIQVIIVFNRCCLVCNPLANKNLLYIKCYINLDLLYFCALLGTTCN